MNKYNRRLKYSVFLFLVAGCSTSTNFKVTPLHGQTQTQYYAEKFECQKESSYRSSSAQVGSYYGSASSGQSINEQMVFDCLRGKGYQIDFQ